MSRSSRHSSGHATPIWTRFLLIITLRQDSSQPSLFIIILAAALQLLGILFAHLAFEAHRWWTIPSLLAITLSLWLAIDQAIARVQAGIDLVAGRRRD